jgi:predicted ArsR family transcriptional regulator
MLADASTVPGKEDWMSATPWHRRFVHSTRGRIVALLRRDTRTVDELAQELGLTDNAVRAHLAALERDGWVVPRGVRRSGGSGKPANIYELTANAEVLFPKAYGSIVDHLLDIIEERMPPEEVTAILREVGRRLSSEHKAPTGDLRMRLDTAIRVLNDMGGLAEVDERPGSYAIHCYRCPLADMVAHHPEACQLVTALLTAVIRVPVQERCERGAQRRCSFEVAAM